MESHNDEFRIFLAHIDMYNTIFGGMVECKSVISRTKSRYQIAVEIPNFDLENIRVKIAGQYLYVYHMIDVLEKTAQIQYNWVKMLISDNCDTGRVKAISKKDKKIVVSIPLKRNQPGRKDSSNT